MELKSPFLNRSLLHVDNNRETASYLTNVAAKRSVFVVVSSIIVAAVYVATKKSVLQDGVRTVAPFSPFSSKINFRVRLASQGGINAPVSMSVRKALGMTPASITFSDNSCGAYTITGANVLLWTAVFSSVEPCNVSVSLSPSVSGLPDVMDNIQLALVDSSSSEFLNSEGIGQGPYGALGVVAQVDTSNRAQPMVYLTYFFAACSVFQSSQPVVTLLGPQTQFYELNRSGPWLDMFSFVLASVSFLLALSRGALVWYLKCRGHIVYDYVSLETTNVDDNNMSGDAVSTTIVNGF